MKKIYIIECKDFTLEYSWTHDKAFENLIDAHKEVYWLEQVSMNEETGEVNYHKVREIELVD